MADLDTEEVSYELLQELVRAERRSNRLMPVSARFWPDVRAFLEAVTAEFRAHQEKDPWSRKAMLLSDEAKNAKHAAENLWALRERKLAMLALARERERKRPEGVTADEAQLFDALLTTLDDVRHRVLADPQPSARPPAPSAGPAAAPPAPAPEPAPAPASPSTPAPAARNGSQGPPTPAPEPVPATKEPVVPPDVAGENDAVTIRALGDIPPFVGPDMQTYLLKEGDLATVPPTIAQLLVKRKKAAIVEGI